MCILDAIHVVLVWFEYPATKAELVGQAHRWGASPALIERLEALQEAMYGSVDTVVDALRNEAWLSGNGHW